MSALNDGRENGITSSAGAAFSKYVSDIADEGLIHSYSVTSDGQGNEAFERRDNPTFKEESQPPSELQQALAHQQQKLGASETMGDGNGFRSAQKSIAMIEHQMGIDPTPQAPTPEGLSDDMEIEYHD